MNNFQTQLEKYLTIWFIEEEKNSPPVSLDLLSVQAAKLNSALSFGLTPEKIDEVIRKLTHKLDVFQPDDVAIVKKDFVPWIRARKEHVIEVRSAAYIEMLTDRGWNPRVLTTLDRQTESIVELMGNPLEPGPWHRRGLLMGDVQSGKTATYIGVLNKAIDYGYKVIIVLGGHTNDLRRQTQVRIDHDLAGFDSRYLSENVIASDPTKALIGIRKFDRNIDVNQKSTVNTDFSASSRQSGIDWLDQERPSVFVIKKSVKIIDNVRTYIAQQGQRNGVDLPMVVIDDEADWGSPNTSDPDSDPTKVNASIRALLGVSTRSSYLAITATPFANVLIDHLIEDDLFPSDYIRALGYPSNYRGATEYFLSENQSVRTDVEDCLSLIPLGHKSDLIVTSLPTSLKKAICYFAIAALRKEELVGTKPTSMMINVSVLNSVQAQVFDLVEEFVEEMNSSLSSAGPNFLVNNDALVLLKLVYERDFAGVSLSDEFEKISNVFRQLQIELVNYSTTKDRNKRDKSLSSEQRADRALLPTIYIGGNVLSRGLTLEGLVCSYFVRRAGSADTLLQMGRWFGYRDGYESLVRISMPAQVARLFSNVATLSNELKEDLEVMKGLELTPEEFGLRMRLVPEIAIVASNKAKSASVEWLELSLEGHIRSSLILNAHHRNADAVEALMRKVVIEGNYEKSILQYPHWDGIQSSTIASFVEEFRADPSDPYFGVSEGQAAPLIRDFVNDRPESELWDVVVVSGSGTEVSVPGTDLVLKSSIRNQLRAMNDLAETPEEAQEATLSVANNQLATPRDFYGSLTDSEKSELEKAKLLKHPDEVTKEGQLRNVRKNPLLMIYAITVPEPTSPTVALLDPPLDAAAPLWAVRVFIPTRNGASGGPRRVKVLANSVYKLRGDVAEEENENEE